MKIERTNCNQMSFDSVAIGTIFEYHNMIYCKLETSEVANAVNLTRNLSVWFNGADLVIPYPDAKLVL